MFAPRDQDLWETAARRVLGTVDSSAWTPDAAATRLTSSSLSALRRRRSLTVSDASALLGVPAALLRGWERGLVLPRVYFAAAVTRYGVSFHEATSVLRRHQQSPRCVHAADVTYLWLAWGIPLIDQGRLLRTSTVAVRDAMAAERPLPAGPAAALTACVHSSVGRDPRRWPSADTTPAGLLSSAATASSARRAADLLGVTLPTVRRWEQGSRTPPVPSLPLLAVAYDVPVATLLSSRLDSRD